MDEKFALDPGINTFKNHLMCMAIDDYCRRFDAEIMSGSVKQLNKECKMGKNVYEVYCEVIDDKGDVIDFLAPNFIIAAGEEQAKSICIRGNYAWINNQEERPGAVVNVYVLREL